MDFSGGGDVLSKRALRSLSSLSFVISTFAETGRLENETLWSESVIGERGMDIARMRRHPSRLHLGRMDWDGHRLPIRLQGDLR